MIYVKKYHVVLLYNVHCTLYQYVNFFYVFDQNHCCYIKHVKTDEINILGFPTHSIIQ